MNQLEIVSIGFGDMRGQTATVLVSEQKGRIELGNLKATHVEPPKIKVKQQEALGLGILKECVKKKRDKFILTELLKVSLDCNPDEIARNCQEIENRISNDLAVLGAMMEDTQTDKFIEQTKASPDQARKYLQKEPNLEGAVKLYKEHQIKIEKFAKEQKCDKETAQSFLEANNYDDSFLQ